ncbi:hypothetical protein OH77DRAFT_382159 [Trametes cingulata]|nr:hypothetical protein OH77DRAFT_382159 [Trametes cingulata]
MRMACWHWQCGSGYPARPPCRPSPPHSRTQAVCGRRASLLSFVFDDEQKICLGLRYTTDGNLTPSEFLCERRSSRKDVLEMPYRHAAADPVAARGQCIHSNSEDCRPLTKVRVTVEPISQSLVFAHACGTLMNAYWHSQRLPSGVLASRVA